MNVIVANSLEKSYGKLKAVKGVSLNVPVGTCVAVLGPNGAGKTTLLRACAGLLPIVRGEASVLGVDLSVDRQSVRPRVGLLGHANGLFADLTIGENVMFWAQMVGASEAEVASTVSNLYSTGPRSVSAVVFQLFIISPLVSN